MKSNRKRPEPRQIEKKKSFPIYVPIDIPDDVLRFLNDLKDGGTFSLDIVEIVNQYYEARKFLEPNRNIKTVPEGKTLVQMFQKHFGGGQVTTTNDVSIAPETMVSTPAPTTTVEKWVQNEAPSPLRETSQISSVAAEHQKDPTSHQEVAAAVEHKTDPYSSPATSRTLENANKPSNNAEDSSKTSTGSSVTAERMMKNRNVGRAQSTRE